ncbi:MAG TPA: SpoIIE family protein phosphatase [Baekduia sp.]|nr:SpoIIE family protein phosphatase [Baekduia sp.]
MDVPEATDGGTVAPGASVGDGQRLPALLRGQKDVFELLARRAPLPDILARLAVLVEQQSHTGALASILLVDEAGTRLRHGAAPSLPDAYTTALDGLVIDEGAASCGTAAHRREPVIVADIASDPLWAAYRDAASAAGLRACCSVPILGQSDELLGTFAIYHREPTEPDDGDQALLASFQQAAALAIDRDRDHGALVRAKRRAEALHRVGKAIASRLDLAEIVQLATDAATELSKASFGAFFYNVIRADGESYMLYTLSGVPRESFERFPMPRNTAIFAPTFNGEGTVRLHDVLADPRYGRSAPYHGMPKGHLPVRSYLAVPVITSDGEVAGGLFFGHPDPGVFDVEAERLVEGIASQAAVAIENARLYADAQREIEARNRAFAERDRVARVLQESLLPSALPAIPGIDVAARYRPCSDGIGGDFYDVFPLPDGRWGVVIGDVCGKGAEAAALTALARHTVRTAAMLHARPGEVLRVLNEALLEHDPSGTRFCTAIFGLLDVADPSRPRLTMARGGHPPAIVVGADGVRAIGGGGRLLGAFAELDIDDDVIFLNPGDTILLHTDGLTDVGRDSDVLGAEWVDAVLRRHGGESAAMLVDRLADGAVALQATAAGRDDIAVLAVGVRPVAAQRAA